MPLKTKHAFNPAEQGQERTAGAAVSAKNREEKMRIIQIISQERLALAAAGSLLALTGAASAADRPDYGGKMSLTVVQQEARPLDAKGHVAVASIYKGTNASIGRLPWMDGAEVLMTDVADLDRGNGVAHGAGFDLKDGAASDFTYVNAIKTVLVDGKPITTAEGEVSKADGPMKDIRVKCNFMSQTTLECEWTARAAKAASR
jgi:hypothetical protein